MSTLNLPFNNTITTILFDLDGTLIKNAPSSLDVFLQILAEKSVKQAKLPQTWPRVRRWIHYYWAQSPELAEDVKIFGNSGDLTEAFWLNYLRKKLGVVGIPEERANELLPEVGSLMEARYHPQSSVLDNVSPTLSALQEQGVTLGLVSNRSNPFQDEIEELGLAAFFHFAFTAGEVGSWKPDEKIFHHALNKAGSSPEKTIYVGDNYYADVLGAQRVSIRSILVDPKGVFPDAACPVIDSIEKLVNL